MGNHRHKGIGPVRSETKKKANLPVGRKRQIRDSTNQEGIRVSSDGAGRRGGGKNTKTEIIKALHGGKKSRKKPG